MDYDNNMDAHMNVDTHKYVDKEEEGYINNIVYFSFDILINK